MKLNTSTKDLWKTVHTDNIQNWNFYVSKTGNYPSAWRQIHKGMQYVHTMWQFSARKRNKFELYRTHNDSQKHQAEWKKSDQKEHVLLLCILNDPIYLKSQSRQKKKILLNEEKDPSKKKTLQYKKVSDQCYLWGGSSWEPRERAWGDFLRYVNALTLTSWSLGYSSLIAQLVKNLPAMQETLVWFLGREDPLEKG